MLFAWALNSGRQVAPQPEVAHARGGTSTTQYRMFPVAVNAQCFPLNPFPQR